MIQQEVQPIDIVPPPSITSGKITNNEFDVQYIAQLLSEARAFYDAEMVAQIINAMLRSYHQWRTKKDNKKSTIESVTP